ncbi:hypothetical protein M2171_006969 [Bradyrhizobium japonicum USDA 38]|uniref:Ig-like domain-containing protein n=1 Tax=Bradyrhizobium japonicum TaxID=375 RepID=UPI0009B777CD|nr:Ig-like domain-containing protein [Bradyrhizobium japonicum]MCS3897836.1 hypothetical protein [Bradyrhizobium japonicum USDA 38]MCS3940890.1 hypothetical protein [Bradyrhizobium japonicum]
MAYTFNGVVYPDATTTGVPPGVTLNPYNGDITINTPGTVISGLKITGTVYINADNVTIKDCSITSTGYNVVNIKSGVSGAVVQNCEINGTGNGPQGQTGIGGQGTFVNNNIYNVENGINVEGSNVVIKGNYIHDLNASGGSAGHYDGIQAQGGFNNVLISGNTVLGRDTSCIIIQNAFGPIDNIKVDGNLLLGQNNAAATIYVEEKAGYSGQITNAQVTNNVLGKGFWYWSSIVNTDPVWTNNVDYATGKLVTTNNTLSGTPTTPPSSPATPDAPAIASFSNDTGKVGDGITSDTTLQLKGTAAANSAIKIYDGSTQIGTATANASGSWEYITAVLTNAQHVLKATATNASGQTSAASAALTVTVDNVAPTAPVLKSNTVVETNKVQLSGTAEAGSAISVYDGATLVGAATTAANGSWSITTSALSTGSHTLTAKATDAAGNVSAASQSANPVIGGSTTPPPATPTIVSFSNDSGKVGDNVTSDNTLTLKGTGAANATITVFDGTTSVGSVKADASGNWSLTTAALKDGTHSFTATTSTGSTAAAAAATATASATSPALAITIDTTAPTAPVLKANSVVDTNHVLLSGTAEAGSSIKVYDGSTLVGTGTAGTNGSWSITTNSLSNGTHTLTTTATDVAGNVSAASQAVKPVIGTPTSPAPAAPKIASFSNDSGASATDHITNDNTLTLKGTAVANATVKVFDGTTQVGTVKADGTGNWSLTTSVLKDGDHSLTATGTDSSGKTSVASASLDVKIDTHAPDAPTMGLYSKGGAAVGGTTTFDDLIVKGTAEANSKVAIFDGGKQIGTATAGSNGSWSYDTGHLDDGSHSFTTKAIDVAGNTSGSSAVKGVTVDGHSSPIDITGFGYYSTNAFIKGTADAYSQVKILDGNKIIGTVKADGDGDWVYKATGLSDQVHTFKAQEISSSGQVTGTSSGSAILGSSKGNTLTGTTGDDIFVGNGHPDTFVFDANFGKDFIKDFDSYGRSHDTIQFSKSAFSDFASVLNHASQVGQDVVIANGDDSLTLKNVKLGSLQSHDFHFA